GSRRYECFESLRICHNAPFNRYGFTHSTYPGIAAPKNNNPPKAIATKPKFQIYPVFLPKIDDKKTEDNSSNKK
ncbi:MAG: hypothetical protein AAFW70_07445, partial [Cyanobacteria bacterium J06635_10]